MWNYEKRLQYPVKITQTNPENRPDYHYSVRWTGWRTWCIYAISVPAIYYALSKKLPDILTDIGTEELAHLEIDLCHCASAYP